MDGLRDLVPFVQIKKREKHPWRSVTFSKVAGFHGCFRFGVFIVNFEHIVLLLVKLQSSMGVFHVF